jgi:AcrR family transcriptional regulator
MLLILMNMFTQNVKPRKRGRPPGPTARGAATKDHLYGVAMRLISERGYEATTLRDIAKEAHVSVGLLYRYFPSKQAVITALHDELSTEYARQAETMSAGRWRDRFLFALRASLHVLEPHRVVLRALIPVLVGDPDDGVFANNTTFARVRVQGVFEKAVIEATDAPKQPLAQALGRLLYLVHLAVLLWWLLDKSSKQRATTALVSLTQQLLPSAALTLRVPPVRRFVVAVDELINEALFSASA